MAGIGPLKAVVRTHRLIIWILVAHFAVGSLWSVVIPLWEGYDEWAHYRYVRYVASERTLPEPHQQLVTELGMPDETHQAPLYYLLGALATFWVGTDDDLQPVVNPYAFTGTGVGGVNVAVHDPMVEGFPYRGTVLAVHVARLLSVLLGTAAVWITYLTGRLIFPHRPEVPLGAAAFTAFVPQFLFMGSIVNNDILAVTLSSFVLFLTVKMIVDGIQPLALCLVVVGMGLGAASKHTTLAMVPVVGGGLAIALARQWFGLFDFPRGPAAHDSGPRGELRKGPQPETERGGILSAPVFRWAAAAVLLLMLLLVVLSDAQSRIQAARLLGSLRGYWLMAGYRLGHPTELPWYLVPDALRYGFYTFWASFGWGNVEPEGWVYWFFGILSLAGFTGSIVFMTRKSTPGLIRALLGLLWLAVICAITLPMYRELLMERGLLKGRYILVALPAVSLLIVRGLVQWVPPRLGGALVITVSLGMFVLGIIAPFRHIEPVYARPTLLTLNDVAEIPHPVEASIGNVARLLGYDAGKGQVRAGQAIAITLYWQCLNATERNYTVGVKVLGADQREYGGVNIYPGRGNFATSLWRPGDVFRETYWVPVSSEAPVPSLGQIGVALFDEDQGRQHLRVFDADGRPAGHNAVFGHLKIRPEERPQYTFEDSLLYTLGNEIALIGYQMEEEHRELSLKLYWEALSAPQTDYTVFVQLTSAEGYILAQSDGPPRGGTYPTFLWDRGEIVEDEHTLVLPEAMRSAPLRILVGMYRLETMQRLPVFGPEGERIADDQIMFD